MGFKYHIYSDKYRKHIATNSKAQAYKVFEQLRRAGKHPILHAVRVPTKDAIR